MKKLIKELDLTEEQVKKILLARKLRKPKVLNERLTDEVLRFGVVSDTHLCSNFEALDELHTFYEICRKSGIKQILHAGDILDGIKVYRGQEQEVHTFGAKRQVEYTIKNYPKVEGIMTYFITGNHDEAHWKLGGVDVGEMIAEKRTDLVHLGMYSADIVLGGIRIRLHHGEGGGAYALSYKGQKLIENIPSGKDKPRILLLGHYHTCSYFFARNIHLLNAGAFQRTTPYILRKGLSSAVGGWIVDVRITKDKENDVLAFQPAWIPFF